MICNCYEESILEREHLPESWKESNCQNELESFLQDNWDYRSIYYEDSNKASKQQFLSFLSHGRLRTNQYIGTIMFNDEQVNIFPKVFRNKNSNDRADSLDLKELMRNLAIWLDYCNKAEYPFIDIATDFEEENDLRELFVSLYVSYVKHAVDRGVFYQYIDATDDLECIKGKFDYIDYCLKKIPSGQPQVFRCAYSKFEYDNMVNRIIKYTCKILLPHASGKNKRKITTILSRLTDVTDDKCTATDCDRVRLSKMHNNYQTIVSMSKMILMNDSPSFSSESNKSFCFLFPTDLLFEGFIGGFIKEVVKGHNGKTYLKKSDMFLLDDFFFEGKSYGKVFNMELDILVELNNTSYILDTKYKNISRFENNRESIKKIMSDEVVQSDLYQICEYARKKNVEHVYLLYPMYWHEDKEPSYPVGLSNSSTGTIYVHFIRLPFIFEEDTNKTRKQLKSTIEEILELEEND